MKRWIIILNIIIMLLLVGWLFLGIFNDREFGDRYLFIKHRPTFKFFFSAPIGEPDKSFDSLTPEQKYEESMYRQYIENGGGYRGSIPLW